VSEKELARCHQVPRGGGMRGDTAQGTLHIGEATTHPDAHQHTSTVHQQGKVYDWCMRARQHESRESILCDLVTHGTISIKSTAV
jgi:hypothetical protein